MRVWAVFQKGVYRHGSGGVFDTFGAAIEAADASAAADKDDHHDYVVVAYELNERRQLDGKSYYPSFESEEVLYSVTRSKALATTHDLPKEGATGK